MAVLTEPVPPGVLRVLRQAVVEHHRAVGARRRFHPALHAGLPGGAARALEIRPDDAFDAALRADVVEALARPYLSRPEPLWVWLTRGAGDPVTAGDLAWAAAVGAAGAELERPLGFVVVTRNGWRDPCSGVGRAWARLRVR